MAYAPADRAFYDADSHIMELPNFLRDYADPDVRDKIPPVNYSASIVTDSRRSSGCTSPISRGRPSTTRPGRTGAPASRLS